MTSQAQGSFANSSGLAAASLTVMRISALCEVDQDQVRALALRSRLAAHHVGCLQVPMRQAPGMRPGQNLHRS